MSVSSQSGVFGLKRQANAGYTASGPYPAGVASDAKQRITVTAAVSPQTPGAGDKFTLTFHWAAGADSTGEIAYNVTAADLKTAIVSGIDLLDTADVNVTLVSTGVYDVEFVGNFAGMQIPLMEAKKVTGANSSMAVAVANRVDGGEWHWIPALNVAFQPNQMVQAIPPEVGGSLWARGSYKGGVYGGGNVTLVPRGGLGLAEMLYGFCGGSFDTVTTVVDYDAAEAAKLVGNNTNGVATGNFKYKFVPSSKPGSVLPWYTFVRNVGGKFVEVFPDGHIGSFAFDMAASNILQIDASFTSKSCANVAKTDGGATTDVQIGGQIAGNGLPFQMVDAIVRLDGNDAGSPTAPVANQDYNPTRLNIGFNNELSQNEFVVGSFFLQDITNLARTAQITYSLYLRDAEIYNRVYNHGYAAADGSTSQGWSSEIWKGALNVDLLGGDIGSTSDRYKISITIPEMDYQAAPISLAGNNLVEYQLTTNVVLSQTAGVAPFTIEYTTEEDIFPVM